MTHTVSELIQIAQHYFPPGVSPGSPGYDVTPEIQRQVSIRAEASRQYGAFQQVLRRLDQRFPDVAAENRSYFLQSPEGAGLDRCFDALLDLPCRRPEEKRHGLQFLISIIVPYYVIYSVCGVTDGDGGWARSVSFLYSEDEKELAAAVSEEIQRAFPGYAQLPLEILRVQVPRVDTQSEHPATLLGCLFSDDWLGRDPDTIVA